MFGKQGYYYFSEIIWFMKKHNWLLLIELQHTAIHF